MNEIARRLSREYRLRLENQVERLNTRLMLATALFFFIPFVLVILGSFAVLIFLTSKTAINEIQQLAQTVSAQDAWRLPAWLGDSSFQQTLVAQLPPPSKLFEAVTGSQGQLEINAMKPVIIHAVLQSIRLLADASTSFAARCVDFLIEQAQSPEPEGAFIGLEAGGLTVHSLEEIPKMVDKDNQRPKQQWWLDLRPIAKLMSQPMPSRQMGREEVASGD